MKKLYLDIETAPNKVWAWGLWQQNIAINQIEEPGYTLCWAAMWDKGPVVFESGRGMIKKLHSLLEEADVVIHYNGTRFDIPTVNKEFLLQGMTPPSSYHEIDLLRTVRRRFRFSSNKLDYVAQQLGLGAKTQHMGMGLWRGCMDGDEKCWKTMERYNKQDVRLLKKLYEKLLPWIPNHPNHGVFTESDDPTCRNCGSKNVKKNGIERKVTLPYQRYKCLNCGAPLRARSRLRAASDGVLV